MCCLSSQSINPSHSSTSSLQGKALDSQERACSGVTHLYSSCAKLSARELICTLKNCGGSVPRAPRTVVRMASTTVAGACTKHRKGSGGCSITRVTAHTKLQHAHGGARHAPSQRASHLLAELVNQRRLHAVCVLQQRGTLGHGLQRQRETLCKCRCILRLTQQTFRQPLTCVSTVDVQLASN